MVASHLGKEGVMKREIEPIEEIRKRYPEQWLLIVNYESDELTRPVRGVLAEHSRHRSDIYEKLSECKGSVRIEYSGDVPKDVAVMF